MEPQPRHGQHPFLVSRIAESPDLLANLEAAERLGVSLRRFEGWEPRTFYFYDDLGRLSESVQEPEWDHQEQAWMLALEAYRATRCQGCGGDMHETTDPKNDDRYKALLPVQCHRCAGLMRSQDEYREYPQPMSLMHRVELRRG